MKNKKNKKYDGFYSITDLFTVNKNPNISTIYNIDDEDFNINYKEYKEYEKICNDKCEKLNIKITNKKYPVNILYDVIKLYNDTHLKNNLK